MRAAIYTRISQDRDGEALGVERQEADCRALAQRDGHEVVQVFCDNSVSAYRGSRPEYRRLIESVNRGEIDVILAYRSDRLYRSVFTDLKELIEVIGRTNVSIRTVASGDIDLTSADGIQMATMLAAAAEGESRRMGERVRRQREQQAAEGRRQGGGSRPFGWTDSSMTAQVPTEVAMLREAVEAILTGQESVYSIATRWNAAGLPTAQGARWTPLHLVRTLKRPILAGLRVHARTGTVTRGTWEPVISEEEHQLLLARLESRPNRNGARVSRRTALLSGMLRCASCGVKMQASRGRYVCNRNRNGGCGETLVNEGRLLEAAVIDLSIEASKASRSKRRRQPRRTDPAQLALAEMRTLDRRGEELGVMFGAGDIDAAGFRSAQRVIDERRRELEAALRDAGEPSDEYIDQRGEAFERWTTGDVLRPEDIAILQPIIARTVADPIYVSPRPRGTPFEPSQVALTR